MKKVFIMFQKKIEKNFWFKTFKSIIMQCIQTKCNKMGRKLWANFIFFKRHTKKWFKFVIRLTNESNRLMKNVETRETFFVNLLSENWRGSNHMQTWMRVLVSHVTWSFISFYRFVKTVSFLFFRWSLVKNNKKKCKNIKHNYRWQRE